MFKEALITFFTAMLPVVELRGAIPYGVIAGLSVPAAFIISVIGNLVPIPFAVVFIRRFFEWFRTINSFFDKIVRWFEAKADRNKDKVLKYEFWGLVLLVAIRNAGHRQRYRSAFDARSLGSDQQERSIRSIQGL